MPRTRNEADLRNSSKVVAANTTVVVGPFLLDMLHMLPHLWYVPNVLQVICTFQRLRTLRTCTEYNYYSEV